MRRHRLVAGAAIVSLVLVLVSCTTSTTSGGTYVTSRSATLAGQVSTTVGGEVEHWFEYGATASYDHSTAHRTVELPADVTRAVAEPISGLAAASDVHFRLCSFDSQSGPSRPSCSADRVFTTGTLPPPTGFALQAGRNVYVADPTTGARTLVSTLPFFGTFGGFSPDGRQITYTDLVSGTGGAPATTEVFIQNLDGTGRQRLTTGLHAQAPRWSPDGTRILFITTDGVLRAVDVDGSDPVPLTDGSLDVTSASWSPDGRSVAFSVEALGRTSLYAGRIEQLAVPLQNAPRITTDTGGRSVAWSPDGQELAFVGETPWFQGVRWQSVDVIEVDGTDRRTIAHPPPPTFDPSGFGDIEDVSWSPDGAEVAYGITTEPPSGPFRVAATGGTPQPLPAGVAGTWLPFPPA